jgi:hypothetical protein
MKLLSGEVNPIVNANRRVSGFSPAQWISGKNPRRPGDLHDFGVTQESIDLQSAFYFKSMIRPEAKREIVKLDTSKRVKRALALKASPIPGNYKVGDLIVFKRNQGADTEEVK